MHFTDHRRDGDAVDAVPLLWPRKQYSTAYVDEEAAARAERLGLWRGNFVPPWDWRRGECLVEPAANDNEPSCRIKGNINRDGERIYHLPGGRWYDRTKIDEGKGERWFYSEAEARAAGGRRSGPTASGLDGNDEGLPPKRFSSRERAWSRARTARAPDSTPQGTPARRRHRRIPSGAGPWRH